MNNKIFKIFVDFDGTISEKDVGEAIFEKFADSKKVKSIINKLLADKITSRECWDSLCKIAEIPDKKSFDDFIDGLSIDPSFHDFVDYCRENKFELYILSDGFDYYIKRILEREGLSDIKFYANKLKLTDNNRLIPSYPHFDIKFRSMANCKRNHIISNSADDEYTFFIGDGNSDKEAVEFCDFIFAKDDLLRICEIERITFFPFNNFYDVTKRIETLKNKKRLKKRHQAVLKRKEAYMIE